MPGGRKRSATLISNGGSAPPHRPCNARSSRNTCRSGASGHSTPSTMKPPIIASAKRRSENVAAHHGAKAIALTDIAL